MKLIIFSDVQYFITDVICITGSLTGILLHYVTVLLASWAKLKQFQICIFLQL
jgi:hypothetical protein